MQTAVTSGTGKKSTLRMSAITLLAAVGITISLFSFHHHFGHDKTAFCDLGQSFNCDLVNRSEYSVIAGVPVALIGVLGYLLLLAFATIYRYKAETPLLLLVFSAAGLGFALYLTYIEAYTIHAWCILCLSSLAIIFLITLLSVGGLAATD